MPLKFQIPRMPRIPGLPTTATAPFCPSEVAGSVAVPAGASAVPYTHLTRPADDLVAKPVDERTIQSK